MSTIVAARENLSLSLNIELVEPELDPEVADAACIARAIAQRMDPEWREFVAQEQLDRLVASFALLRGPAVAAIALEQSPTFA